MRKRLLAMLMIMMLAFAAVMLTGCLGGSSDDTADISSDSEAAETEESAAGDSEFNDLLSFTAFDEAGAEYSQEIFADKDVTAINFWGTYCPPCIEEMPSIAELNASLPDNAGLILVCIDGQAEPDAMHEILGEAGYDGMNWVGGDGDLIEFLNRMQYIPTTVFVDSGGHLVSEPIIGGSEDAKKNFTEHMNEALAEMGKEQIPE